MLEQQGKPKRILYKRILHREKSAEQLEKEKTKQGWEQGFQKGKDVGFTQGKEAGFEEGHKHLVALVEETLAKELGLTSREELVKSGKLPALWIITLLRYHAEEAGIKRKPAQAGEPSEIAIEPTED